MRTVSFQILDINDSFDNKQFNLFRRASGLLDYFLHEQYDIDSDIYKGYFDYVSRVVNRA